MRWDEATSTTSRRSCNTVIPSPVIEIICVCSGTWKLHCTHSARRRILIPILILVSHPLWPGDAAKALNQLLNPQLLRSLVSSVPGCRSWSSRDVLPHLLSCKCLGSNGKRPIVSASVMITAHNRMVLTQVSQLRRPSSSSAPTAVSLSPSRPLVPIHWSIPAAPHHKAMIRRILRSPPCFLRWDGVLASHQSCCGQVVCRPLPVPNSLDGPADTFGRGRR